MKVTRLGPARPILINGVLGQSGGVPSGGTSGQVLTATGSNSGSFWGENIARITSNGSNQLLGPYVSLLNGPGIAFSQSSNSLTIEATGTGGTGTLIDHTHAVSGASATGGGGTLAPTVLTASGRVVFSGQITSTVNADQNDFNPASLHAITSIRFTSFTANRTITGINAGTTGEMLILQNNTSFSLDLPNESASSAAANRFRCPNAATYTVRQQGSVILVYLGGRWCVMAG